MTFFNVIPMLFEDDIIVIVVGSDVSILRVGSGKLGNRLLGRVGSGSGIAV